MKKITILFILIFAFALIFSTIGVKTANAQIKWVESYEEGLEKAQKENKNMLILITAPSWCGYCRVLENDVLSKGEVQDHIIKNFIPIKILDTNYDDIKKFTFEGYPTVLIYNPEGSKIAEPYIYTYKSEDFIENTEKYIRKPASTIEETDGKITYTYNSGSFVKLDDKNWEQVEGKVTNKLTLYSEDEYYYYISSYKASFAIPKKGGIVYIWSEKEEDWAEWDKVEIN